MRPCLLDLLRILSATWLGAVLVDWHAMRHVALTLRMLCGCLQVLLRGRAHTVRGKGKSGFIVLRQRTQTIQVPF